MSTHTEHHSRSPADVAYRRAFWSLLLLPLGLVGSFLTGEGLLSALAADPEEPAAWQVLAAGTPAMLVFALPALVVWLLARKAKRLGRSDAWVPALVALVVVLAFTASNVLSLLAQLVLD